MAVTDGTGAVIETRGLRSLRRAAWHRRAHGADRLHWRGAGCLVGLPNLGARFYQPALGRFVSPDPVLQDPGLPVAWSTYVYCGGNPTSYTDHGGRSFWGWVGGIAGGIAGAVVGFLAGGPVGAVAGALAGAAAGAALGGDSGLAKSIIGVLKDPRFWETVAAVVALVALTALSIVTFGATAGLLVVGIGVLAGGLISRGISAAQQKGASGWDIVTGALVGAAVGGWAAFGTVFAGSAAVTGVNALLGNFFGAGASLGSVGGGILSGAVNGAIAGAASGFTTGFAGGKGKWDWGKFFSTIATGAIVGGILGGSGIAQLLKSDGGGFRTFGVQPVGSMTMGGSTGSLYIDPLQSFFQGTATVLATATKISSPEDKGWLKFGFGILEYDAEAVV